MPARQIIHYDHIVGQICKYVTTDEVRETVSQADAMRVYALRAKDRLLLDKAIEVKFLAQVRGGEILIDMAERGDRATQGKGEGRAKIKGSRELPLTLDKLKLTKTESSRWQRLARMPKAQRAERLKLAQRKARAAIDAAAKQLRVELRAADEARIKSLKAVEGKFKTIVVDPPWDYEWLSIAGRASPGYATMDHEQLMAMRIQKWAEDNAHMYLWVTNNFMTRGVALMEHWGFQHKTVLTWNKLSKKGKPWFGLGSYFRNSTEHVLFGVRGTLRTRVGNIPTLFTSKIGEHSEKPQAFYDIVSKASYLPAVEFFARKPRPGFVNPFQEQKLEAAE